MAGGIGSGSTIGRAIGIAVAVVGVIGYFVFGWRFGSGGGLSSSVGFLVAVLAAGLVIYRYFDK